jgi:hypothetical protein
MVGCVFTIGENTVLLRVVAVVISATTHRFGGIKDLRDVCSEQVHSAYAWRIESSNKESCAKKSCAFTSVIFLPATISCSMDRIERYRT